MSEEGAPNDGDATSPPRTAPATVDVPSVERYVRLERLGEGAMGVVWAAYDRTLDRKVALKVLHDSFLGAIDQERLAEEARAMARLSHPNVVTVYDIGVLDGRTFVTMELVAGAPLSRWLATPRSWQAVVAVFREISSGLAAAHEAGVVHRDVKPSNILLGADGRPRIADFGIARTGIAAGSPPARKPDGDDSSSMTGSPAYMSPERLRGEVADANADQFGCCVTLYEALYGRRPFDVSSREAMLRTMEAGVPPADGSIPRWLHAVVARGLAVDPAARFPSMRALEAALRGPRRRRWPIVLAAGVAIGAGALVVTNRSPAGPSCDAVTERLDGAWSPLVAMQVTGRFGGTGLPYAAGTARETVRLLDRYASDWTAMARDTCRAARVDRTRSVATLERRQLCLDRRRGDLVRAVDLLRTLDGKVLEQAPAVVRGLDPIADCADPTYLDELDAPVPAIDDELALARLLLFSGRYDEGRATAQGVIDAAKAASDRDAECSALVLRGRMEGLARDAGASIASLRAAAALAGELGASRLRAEALIFLSSTLQEIGRLPDATEVLDAADAILAVTTDPLLAAHAEAARGTLLGRQTRYADAVPHFQRALDGFAQIYGLDSDALIPILGNLALAQRRSGNPEEALRHVRRARDLAAPLGATHPIALKARRDLAIAISQAGAPAEAEVELRALHEVRRRLRPDGDLAVAMSASDLGNVLSTLDRLEEALVRFREALEIRERLAPGARATLMERANVADTLNQLGRPAEAEPVLREVLAERERTLGPTHGDVALGYLQLGSVASELRRFDEASRHYERARSIYQSLHGAKHAAVARALHDSAVNERKRRRSDAAARLSRKALDIRLQALPAGHPERIESLGEVAMDAHARGARREALKLATQAVDESTGDDFEAARVRWVLATILDADAATRERARELATEARARFSRLPGPRARAAEREIDDWLAARVTAP